jgi:hypothetical protein
MYLHVYKVCYLFYKGLDIVTSVFKNLKKSGENSAVKGLTAYTQLGFIIPFAKTHTFWGSFTNH